MTAEQEGTPSNNATARPAAVCPRRLTSDLAPSRGQVIRADVGLTEPKLFVVVSNNRRNKNLGQVLAARLTTTAKPPIPSIVPLSHEGRLSGSVVCDDIVEIYRDEVIGILGALTPTSMRAVNHGLKAALDLP